MRLSRERRTAQGTPWPATPDDVVELVPHRGEAIPVRHERDMGQVEIALKVACLDREAALLAVVTHRERANAHLQVTHERLRLHIHRLAPVLLRDALE